MALWRCKLAIGEHKVTVKHAKKTFPCHTSSGGKVSRRAVHWEHSNQSHHKNLSATLLWAVSVNLIVKMGFHFPIFLHFLLLLPTNSLACITVVKRTKADAVNAITNTLTNAAGIVLSTIPKVLASSHPLPDQIVLVFSRRTRNASEKVWSASDEPTPGGASSSSSSSSSWTHPRFFQSQSSQWFQVDEFEKMFQRRMFDISEPLFHSWLSLKFAVIQSRGDDVSEHLFNLLCLQC